MARRVGERTKHRTEVNVNRDEEYQLSIKQHGRMRTRVSR